MDVSSLETHVGYWLRYVSNHVSHAFSARLAHRGVTVAEWVILRELFDVNALSPSAIAERVGMTRGAISKLVDRLADKRLVARKAAPGGDRRFQSLALTAKGRAIVPDLAALADANDAEFFGHLTHDERAAIVRAMQDIVHRKALRDVPTD